MFPHPAFKHKYIKYWEYLNKKNIEITECSSLSIEEKLCACDLVTTCFSTVGVDHAYLSGYADESIGAVLYLLCGDEIKRHLYSNFGYYRNPLLEDNLGYSVEDCSHLVATLNSLFVSSDLNNKYFLNSKTLQKLPAVSNIIDTVRSYI
jgi:hypothetical protein